MVLFVVGHFFRRRRPPRANDDMPLRPLVDVMLFWAFFGIGALCGSVAIAAYAAGFDWPSIAAGAVSLACLGGAFAMWRRVRT